MRELAKTTMVRLIGSQQQFRLQVIHLQPQTSHTVAGKEVLVLDRHLI
jgi:hypothetical protein